MIGLIVALVLGWALVQHIVSPLSAQDAEAQPAHARAPRDQALTGCGPHTLTYRVTAADDRDGLGIRCVKYLVEDGLSPRVLTNDLPPHKLAVWYGEGHWGSRTYRHVGSAYSASDGGTLMRGYAGDITGNGEDYGNAVDGDMTLQITSGSWPNPSTIEVRGAWTEDWTLVSQVALQPLPRPEHSCGPHFDMYGASHLPFLAPGEYGTGVEINEGTGLRCVLMVDEAPGTTWFGNGWWKVGEEQVGDVWFPKTMTYTHIGYRSLVVGEGGASDLCDSAFGDFCGSSPGGSLHFQAMQPRGYKVSGAWDENWH